MTAFFFAGKWVLKMILIMFNIVTLIYYITIIITI